AKSSGQGQVVDAAMVDGVSHLMAMQYAMLNENKWQDQRGENLLDGGAPFYNYYQCQDQKWVSIGPIEKPFYDQMVTSLELDPALFYPQWDREKWPDREAALASLFISKPRDYWVEKLQDTDICFAPVLTMKEAPDHPHLKNRRTFVEKDGVKQPSPAPKFSRTRSTLDLPPPQLGVHRDEILAEWLAGASSS
ncbi:MAG: CoA transferase, partial [Alphaproteobacteria bacterium]|nr:CoA transferase [Alphaproteobacteria bacterium]